MFSKLIKWSKSNYTDLPWRSNRSLYTTLVSEIMLQQTTVSTVLNHYQRFLDEYPDIDSLAATTEEEVCMSWKGLGYYRRARNLRLAAIDIRDSFNSEIPLNYDELTSIKGIGDYTANAIIGIGANKRALAIDANIERVTARILGVKSKKGPKLHKILKEKFENNELKLKKGHGHRELNEALMDLGRTFCQARKASCELCPVREECKAFESGDVLSYPEKQVSKVTKYYDLQLLRLVVKKGKKVLGFEKTDKEWLSGQIELPTFVVSSEDESLKQYPKLSKKIEVKGLKKIKTSITKYRITNYYLEISEKEFTSFSKAKKYKFVSSDESRTNFSTASIKVLNKL